MSANGGFFVVLKRSSNTLQLSEAPNLKVELKKDGLDKESVLNVNLNKENSQTNQQTSLSSKTEVLSEPNSQGSQLEGKSNEHNQFN